MTNGDIEQPFRDLLILRDVMRKRLGKRWDDAFNNAKTIIQMAMAKNQCNELGAALKMCEFIDRKFQGDERKQGKEIFLAVAIEMIVPTL